MRVTDQFRGDFIDALCVSRDDDTVLTIDAVYASGTQKCADGRTIDKPVLGFKGTAKKLILNKTNAKILGLLYGNEMDNWIGRKLALFLTTTEAFGQKDVLAVRVRPKDPETGRSFNMFVKPGARK
ncbi:hypothetical protein EBZ39_02880 [bacterium]|nr:hypothetical protein [bacterium]